MKKPVREPSGTRTQSGKRAPSKPLAIVGIGASAGGFEAFKLLLAALPARTGMAFIFIQHLEASHESLLAKLLGSATNMMTAEVKRRTPVIPDHVYVIAPNTGLRIESGVLHVVRRKSPDKRHLPVDDFFQSLAHDQGTKAIGIVLSGTATDGTYGLRSIRAEGGITFAQDPETAKFDGMPASAIMADCVDFVLPPERIAAKLVEISRHPYVVPRPASRNLEDTEGRDSEWLRLFQLLKAASGVDFNFYKKTTIRRRVARRMALRKIDKLGAYLKVLGADRKELDALQEDILIHVTSFFREPSAFEAFQKRVLPKLLKGKQPAEPLRLWVAGCSTGEEVYSLALCLFETLGKRTGSRPLQIFGTDVSEQAIETARAGIYSAAALTQVSSERIRTFFTKIDGKYQINPVIREVCIFARHDLTKDPPFSRLDVVSCRNVLIYLEPVLQKKVVASFHYALRDTGFLILGKSETLGRYSELFTIVDRKNKFFSRRPYTRTVEDFDSAARTKLSTPARHLPPEPAGSDLEREADRYVWEHYSHAGLVVDNELQILHFRGDTVRYLRPMPGKASLQLLRMLREELVFEVRAAIHKVARTGVPVRREGIRLANGKARKVSIEALPLAGAAKGEKYFLVLFETTLPGKDQPSTKTRPAKPEPEGSLKLKSELARTREYLQSIIKEQESSNEELKTANEEALSSMEELQSTNEELETAKEELQSSNEELITLNEQLQNRNVELGRTTDDLVNVLAGINIPVIILDADRRVRRFTPAAERVLHLIPGDVGRALHTIRIGFDLPGLEEMITAAMTHGAEIAEEVQANDGRWYSIRIFPYRTSDQKIDGVILGFVDIHELRRTRESVQREMDLTSAILDAATDLLVVVLDPDGRVVRFNRSCQELAGYSANEVQGRHTWEFLVPFDTVPVAKAAFTRALDGAADHVEYQWLARDGRRLMISWSNTVTMRNDVVEYVISAGIDTTKRRHDEISLRTMTARVLAMQEQSGKLMARELHDGISQKLAALRMETSGILKANPESPETLTTRIKDLARNIGMLTEDVHRMSRQLHPKILDDLGLEAAMREECISLSSELNIPVEFQAQDVPRTLPEDLSLCFLRVTQEALRNVATHSNAGNVRVSLMMHQDNLFLDINDSGDGFDFEKIQHKGGLGLVSMEERFRLVGGKFAIHSQPGKGTRIEAQAPLPERSQ